MVRTRPAPGGGTVVEIPQDDLTGWINRFASRNDGMVSVEAAPDTVVITAANGVTASLAVPFAPMVMTGREPVEALLDHLAGFTFLALLAVRGGAHSVGIARRGVVEDSKTHRPYLQGRTAAGGWSQQRYARRRGNQLAFSLQHAADAAVHVLLPAAASADALVLGGDHRSLQQVLSDPRLASLNRLPHRVFADIGEPRRAVLDELVARARAVEITIREPASG